MYPNTQVARIQLFSSLKFCYIHSDMLDSVFRDCFPYFSISGGLIKRKQKTKNKAKASALDTLLNSASWAEFVALFVFSISWLTPKCRCYSRGAQRETIKTTGLILIYRLPAKMCIRDRLNWAAQYWREQKCIIWLPDLIRCLRRKTNVVTTRVQTSMHAIFTAVLLCPASSSLFLFYVDMWSS